MGEVLVAGGRLFVAGLSTAFPWVLAAELTPLLPGGTAQSVDVSNLDMASLHLGTDLPQAILLRMLLLGLVQALCYAFAVLQLAALAGERMPGLRVWQSVRAIPSVFIGYLAYSLVVILGLTLSLIVFLNCLALGVWPALAITLVPLVPTAVISTALALFVYPAVLEKCGPFKALGESARLAKSSWARTAVVISVPALVLMCVWVVNNGVEVAKLLGAINDVVAQLQDGGMSMTDLQNQIMSAVKGADDSSETWRAFGAILGAFAWWYTLAVCYAEYRALKEQDSAAAKGK